MRFRTMPVVILFVLFSSVAAGTSLIEPSLQWTRIDQPIECAPDGVCTEDDTFQFTEPDGQMDTLHLSSGSTGYCGFGGVQRSFSVPSDADTLILNTSARKDRWAGRSGVQINGDWVVAYSTDNPNRTAWAPEERRINVAGHAGDTVTVTVAIEDTSSNWCNMGDHGIAITVHDLRFTDTSTEQGQSIVGPDMVQTVSLQEMPEPARRVVAVFLMLAVTAVFLRGLQRFG